jgi:hypothetical protein
MDAIENIALIAALIGLGVATTWAVLIGLIYFFEVMGHD